MNKSLIAVVLMAVIAVAGGFYFLQSSGPSAEELRLKRANAELVTQQQTAEARIESLTKEVALLKKETARLQGLQDKNPSTSADAAVAKSESSETSAKEGEEPAVAKDSKKAAPSFMKGLAKMMNDPEMKKMMISQQAAMVKMMYGDLSKELGLDAVESEQVMSLLAERQGAMQEAGMKMMNSEGELDKGKMEEVTNESKSAREDFDKKLKNVLGAERFSKLQEYESTVGDRMQMTQLQQQFISSGHPLQPEQSSGLLAVMKEERAKTPASAFAPGSQDAAGQFEAMQSEETMNKIMADQEDWSRRVQERAHTILTPDQMTSFAAAQKQQIEMQKMGMKMAASMFKSDEGATPAPAK